MRKGSWNPWCEAKSDGNTDTLGAYYLQLASEVEDSLMRWSPQSMGCYAIFKETVSNWIEP